MTACISMDHRLQHSAKEDCAVAALPVEVEGFGGLNLDASAKDGEQAYGLDTAPGPPMHVLNRTT
jgi:hypothetical protein